jgi:hypothetical protein
VEAHTGSVVSCQHGNGLKINAGAERAGISGATAELRDNQASVNVEIYQIANGTSTNWATQNQGNWQFTSTFTRTGDTNKITGTVAQVENPGPPVPFELDVTCPQPTG